MNVKRPLARPDPVHRMQSGAERMKSRVRIPEGILRLPPRGKNNGSL